MRRPLVFVAFVFACGDDASPPPGDSAMPVDGATVDVDVSTCGSIGTACGACPGGHECVDGACIRVRGDCGGFAGADCQDSQHVCVYPASSTAGLCMLPDEFACACAVAPGALSGCMP
jgi:hypothetical protein